MRRPTIALALLCAVAAPAGAQDGLLQSCSVSGLTIPESARDPFHQMCAQVVNAFANVQPGVGMTFSGGNPVLGTGSTLGRRLGLVPRFSATARTNVTVSEVPGLFEDYTPLFSDDSDLAAMEVVRLPMVAFQGDVALGLFNGLSLGPALGGFGAVDLLGSVAFLPKVDRLGLADPIVSYGGGLRVGILQQGLVTPGISLSGLYRRMGSFGFGDREAGDPGDFEMDLRTLSLRAVASKGILLLDLAVGAGYDRYTSDVALGWRITCATSECRAANSGQVWEGDGQIQGELTTAAWNVFGNVALNLLVFNLVGEVGYQKAVDPLGLEDLEKAGLPRKQLTDGDLKGGRLFGSVGLRVSF